MFIYVRNTPHITFIKPLIINCIILALNLILPEMKRVLTLILPALIILSSANAQRKSKKSKDSSPVSTSATAREDGFKKRQALLENSLVNNIPFRSVGPTVMSGRVVDLAVDPSDPAHFYVAFASGGLWETKNEGASYEPLFDSEIVMTIGDIAVDWTNNVLYVGTGENNSSRSSYSGFGVFSSSDGGKTWKNIGLKDSHHISRIILHPTESGTMWVAALGHLYTPNNERGVFKTEDGGNTWKKTLFVDNESGAVDLIIDPTDPNKLWASTWQKDRKAWNFNGAGSGSGIYGSTDGGSTWSKLNGSASGFPDSNGVGRIGLAISPSSPNILYAVHDNQERREKDDDDEKSGLTKEDIRAMSNDDFLALSNNEINDFLDNNRFPGKYNAVDIKAKVKSGSLKPMALVEYLEDANSLLFDTPVKGAEVYKSIDAGKSWTKTHEKYLDDVYYSYGYYFGQIRVDAQNPDMIYTYGVPIIKSGDGGKTWNPINGDNVHADHHALWVNPNKSGHLILGNDGGVNISYDNGESWIHTNNLSVGQFYTVNVDMAKPYNVYGGLQDNGVWKGPSTYEYSPGWYSNGEYPYKRLMGGDGMQVVIDTRDNNTVYTGYQFGNYSRVDATTGQSKYITPKHELGERPLRWNWQSPIHLSIHNQDILYMGSNKFHRSMNQGDEFETLSGDLTKGGRKGNVSYGTLTSIDESPLKFGLIYVGSDDGLVHVSKDGGNSFTKVSNTLPQDMWVSRVEASNHKEDRVYISLNGYRWDNFESMVYVSENNGSSWKKIGTDLPAEPVNVIKEDPANENILYVGTDHGVYVSVDRGTSFMAMEGGIPATPVHDLVIHPRDKDLVVGTHGRSIYIANVEHLQQMNSDLMAKSLHIFPLEKITYSEYWGRVWSKWWDSGKTEIDIPVFSSNSGDGKVTIVHEDGTEVQSFDISIAKGLNYISYDLSISESAKTEEMEKADNGKYYIQPGKYTLKIELGGSSSETTFSVDAARQRPKRKGSE